MKIKNVNDVLPPVTPLTPRTSGSAKETGQAPVASSEVTLSSLSAKVAEATNGIKAADGAFDAGRVAAVRQRLDEGNYVIDAGKIADAVIAQMALSARPALQ